MNNSPGARHAPRRTTSARPPGFSLAYRRDHGDVVVRIEGELDLCTAPLLRESLLDLIDGQGNLAVVLDLHAVTFIDSVGLSVMVAAHKKLEAKGGTLQLARISERTRRVLDISGISQFVTILPESA